MVVAFLPSLNIVSSPRDFAAFTYNALTTSQPALRWPRLAPLFRIFCKGIAALNPVFLFSCLLA